MIEFTLGIVIGAFLAGYVLWGMYEKEMGEWKDLFRKILTEHIGYESLKNKLKERK